MSKNKVVAVSMEVYADLGSLAGQHGTSVANVIRCLVDGVKKGTMVIDSGCLASLDPRALSWKKFNDRSLRVINRALAKYDRPGTYSIGKLIMDCVGIDDSVTATGIRRVLPLIVGVRVATNADKFELEKM